MLVPAASTSTSRTSVSFPPSSSPTTLNVDVWLGSIMNTSEALLPVTVAPPTVVILPRIVAVPESPTSPTEKKASAPESTTAPFAIVTFRLASCVIEFPVEVETFAELPRSISCPANALTVELPLVTVALTSISDVPVRSSIDPAASTLPPEATLTTPFSEANSILPKVFVTEFATTSCPAPTVPNSKSCVVTVTGMSTFRAPPELSTANCWPSPALATS